MVRHFLNAILTIPLNVSLFLTTNNLLIINYKNKFFLIFIKPPIKLTFSADGVLLLSVNEFVYNKNFNNNKYKIKSLFHFYKFYFKNILENPGKSLKAKVDLKGVGFKASLVETSKGPFVKLLLGYSHPIFVKVPFTINISIIKPNKFFIVSNNKEDFDSFLSGLKRLKPKDSYKGKGFIFNGIIKKLKESKKI